MKHYIISCQNDSLELINGNLKIDILGVRVSCTSISYIACYFIAEFFQLDGENVFSSGLNLT